MIDPPEISFDSRLALIAEIESSVSFTPVDDTETIRFLYGQMDSLSKIGIALGERVRVLTQERDLARIERDNWRWAAQLWFWTATALLLVAVVEIGWGIWRGM